MDVKAPRFWGEAADGDRLAWSWVGSALEGAEAYWIVATASSGHPVSRPVWGVWLDDRLCLTIGSPTILRAVGAREHVEVHLPSPHDVVIVEGAVAALAGDQMLRRFCDVYNAKYRWNLEPSTAGDVVAVQPEKVIAWRTEPAERCSPDMDFPTSSGTWVAG